MNKRWKDMKGEGMTSDDTPLRGVTKPIQPLRWMMTPPLETLLKVRLEKLHPKKNSSLNGRIMCIITQKIQPYTSQVEPL